MTKVLIMNSYDEYAKSDSNKGAEAVLVSTIEILKKCIPDAEFTTTIQCSDSLSNQLNCNVIRNKVFSFKAYSPYTSLKSTIDLLRCLVWQMFRKCFKLNLDILLNNKKLREFANADLIIHLGMDLYSSDFGSRTVYEESKNILICTTLGKPIMLWAESIGPFKGVLTKRLSKYTLNKVNIISVRETISAQYLQEIGVTKPRVELTADPAFLLTPSPASRIDQIFDDEGISKGNSLTIGITPSVTYMGNKKGKKNVRFMRWMYITLQYVLPESVFKVMIDSAKKSILYSGPELEQRKYMQSMAQIIDYLVANMNATVILIPHVLGKGALIEEKSIAMDIFQAVEHKNNVYVITGNYMTQEIKGIIGQCELFMGGRMHSNIAALSQGIPSIGLAYSHKFMGIMSMLGQENYVCNNLMFDDMVTKIKEISSKREKLAMEIKDKTNILKQLALSNGRLAKELLFQ